MTFPRVLVRSEESGGRISVIESVMPAGATGPSPHRHDFDETFYVFEGELTFLLDGEPHTFTNRGAVDTRYLVVRPPAGFEREFARRAARKEGVEPPEWTLQEIPPVERVGPPVGEG